MKLPHNHVYRKDSFKYNVYNYKQKKESYQLTRKNFFLADTIKVTTLERALKTEQR